MSINFYWHIQYVSDVQQHH